ncbi:hypothetical protein Ahy_A03g013920 [Arachis hypogaea]|uniref:Uncharacterized protein n=1 Tax=Arachis hypogaea TaxID=3818 RepID=A0A445DWI5_ARAHY|nr:hypothetical protein Ahy_A03g013920 [Arachis hypogaea]
MDKGLANEETVNLRNGVELATSVSDKHVNLLRPSVPSYPIFREIQRTCKLDFMTNPFHVLAAELDGSHSFFDLYVHLCGTLQQFSISEITIERILGKGLVLEPPQLQHYCAP